MATNEAEPMLSPTSPPNRKLYYFVVDARERFQEIVDARHVIFYEEMREPIFAAFNELKNEQEDAQGGQFPKLLRMLESPPRELNSQLENAGLTGSQLTMKLSGYVNSRNEFKRKGGIWLLKRLLRWLNTLLGSMALVPLLTNLVEPIKELKEAIENMVEDIEGK